MSKLPVAPGLSNVKKMGKMGYGREMTVKEIDDSLAKNGSWVASENERRQIKQMAQDPIEPEIIKAPPNDALIRKKIEAATRRLKERGEI